MFLLWGLETWEIFDDCTVLYGETNQVRTVNTDSVTRLCGLQCVPRHIMKPALVSRVRISPVVHDAIARDLAGRSLEISIVPDPCPHLSQDLSKIVTHIHQADSGAVMLEFDDVVNRRISLDCFFKKYPHPRNPVHR